MNQTERDSLIKAIKLACNRARKAAQEPTKAGSFNYPNKANIEIDIARIYLELLK